uniref:Phosphoinositide phospholipase C n=1 Tax=Lactuca sativa TaxID=4236 RepID=A0A9R1UWU9_LACSA|nr:hypothetical protein LSAT_V11C800394360 [Lactuca sativa]
MYQQDEDKRDRRRKNGIGNYNYYKMFGCFNRKFKISDLGPPQDVIEVFRLYSTDGSEMLPDKFLLFLTEFQGEEGITIEDAQQIMDRVLDLSTSHLTRYAFTVNDFFHYLLDEINGPLKTQVHQDMTAPLQHYFIYTGHNSYLTGNQLSSDSSEVPIIRALQRGVRGIELDLWPNNARDGIHVLHGRTLTTPVTLLKCLKSIKEHAFVQSPYPVIITLEDHLTPSLQAKVAEMVTSTFGDMLYFPHPSDKDEFPSPDELKYHIILSTKPPKEYLPSKNAHKRRSSVDKDSSDDEWEDLRSNSDDDDDDTYSISDRSYFCPSSDRCSASSSTHRMSDILGVDYEDDDNEDEKSGHQTALEYKHLIAIHASKPKKGTRKALMDEPGKAKRLSVSEQALQRAASLYGADIVRFTQKYILRVFPKGTRVTSTNFRPLTAWMHGAQMVAFNMQGYGRSLWMMHGMFRANGGCGYVRKPDFLMQKGPNGEVFDPKATLPVKTTLKVKVYMGDGWRLDFSQTHFDAYSPPDFYTKINMRGVAVDVSKKRTRVIVDDWTPTWNEEFTFPLRVPELALLEILVQEYDVDRADFAGQTCLPVSELRPGIRVVPLHNKKGEKFKSVKLLMRFLFV